MKRKLLIIIVLLVMLSSIFSLQDVFAADDIASGNDCGVDWRITAEGELIIGKENTTQTMSIVSWKDFPWLQYDTQITSCRIEGTVISSGNLAGMFYNMRYMKSVDLSGLDTSKAYLMTAMFYSCSSLKSLDVSGFDTGKVANMDSMFWKCSSLTSLDLSNFDTSIVSNMNYMFYGCSSLTTLDLSGFDTGMVTKMTQMFYDCRSLIKLDLSNFDTSNVTSMSSMFALCVSLPSLDLSGFDMSSLNDSGANNLFNACSSLKMIETPKNLVLDVELPLTMYDSEGRDYSSLPKILSYSISLSTDPAHSWTEEVTKPATCTSDGVKTYTCSNCGAIKTETIPKTGHLWNAGAVTRKAGYTHTGVKTHTCTVCGATKSTTIPKLNPAPVTPARAKVVSAKVKNKKVTVKWNRIAAKTRGYQVAVKNKKTKQVKIYNVKASSKSKITKTLKLKKGTYAVMVRAYNVVNGETIYGKWSNVKVGKVK